VTAWARQGARKLPGQACLAIGRAVYDLDLCGDADRLLCVLSALYVPGTTDFNFFHFWWHTLTGRSLAVGVSMVLVGCCWRSVRSRRCCGRRAPRMIEGLGPTYLCRGVDRPMTAFVAFLIFSIIVYLPMHLIFGDSSWLEPGHYPFSDSD